MQIYNLIRVGPFALPFLILDDRKARKHEKELHRVFKKRRFKMTPTRIWLKRLAMVGYFLLCRYTAQNYVMDTDIYIGMALGFTFLFHVEIKVGISKDAKERAGSINNEGVSGSGKTEWFALPLFFAPVIPLATLWKANKVIFVFLLCLIAATVMMLTT